MARRSTLRASDHDRERIAERLRTAAVEGRLLAHELEERLALALRARTYGELDAVVADLPAKRRRKPAATLTRVTVALALAIVAVTALAVVAAVVLTLVFAAWFVWIPLVWMYFHRRRLVRARRLTAPGAWQRSPRGVAGGFTTRL